ncbi:MAG: hypothetical protein ACLU38_01785 [Dysosmobacter sp.]
MSLLSDAVGAANRRACCDRCEEDKAAVSRSLEYLEQNGYVTGRTSDTAVP